MRTIFKGTFCYRSSNLEAAGGWCHLRVLQGSNKLSKQVLVIATQMPTSPLPIRNYPTTLVSYVINFFQFDPASTTYIEHIHTESQNPPQRDEDYNIVEFRWEEVLDYHYPRYAAHDPKWVPVKQKDIDDLIKKL